MNVIAIISIFAVVLAGGLVLLARRQGMQLTGMQDLEDRWQKVDMASFLNLADPAEERYLRRRLSGSEFRRIQRMRVRVMWEYLGRLAFNSKLMMQAAQIVQHHSEGTQLQEATLLVATASRMRLLIFAADAYLAIRFLLPETSDPIRTLVAKYQSLTDTFNVTCGRQLAAVHSVAS